MNKANLTRSALISSAITSLYIVVITIAGELYKVAGPDGKMVNPIKDYLKATLGHHWVGKGVWAVALFFLMAVVIFLINKNRDNIRPHRSLMLARCSLVLGTIAIYGFFIYEYVVLY